MAIIKTIKDNEGNQVLPVTVLEGVIDSKKNKNLREILEESSSVGASPMIKISYEDLVELKNTKDLIPGIQYCIKDYKTTVKRGYVVGLENKVSCAENFFDVIVVADSVDALNENARVVKSNRDTFGYFNNNNLNAWKIKYCLDNDINRFDWADTVNGKGVIYYMKDEFNNELPYDFKNIKINDYYAFTNNSADFSLTSNCRDNSIKECYTYCYRIPNVYFTNIQSCTNIQVGPQSNVTSTPDSPYNIDLKNIKIGTYCNNIEFYNSCDNIIINDSSSMFKFIKYTTNLEILPNVNGSYPNCELLLADSNFTESSYGKIKKIGYSSTGEIIATIGLDNKIYEITQ